MATLFTPRPWNFCSRGSPVITSFPSNGLMADFFPRAASAYLCDGVWSSLHYVIWTSVFHGRVSFWAAGLGFRGLVLSTPCSFCSLPAPSSFQCCAVISRRWKTQCCGCRAADGGRDTDERGSSETRPETSSRRPCALCMC